MSRVIEDGLAFITQARDAASRGELPRAISKLDTATSSMVAALHSGSKPTFVYGKADWWESCGWRSSPYLRLPQESSPEAAVATYLHRTQVLGSVMLWTADACPNQGQSGFLDVCIISDWSPVHLEGGMLVYFVRHFDEFHACEYEFLVAPPELQGYRVVASFPVWPNPD